MSVQGGLDGETVEVRGTSLFRRLLNAHNVCYVYNIVLHPFVICLYKSGCSGVYPVTLTSACRIGARVYTNQARRRFFSTAGRWDLLTASLRTSCKKRLSR